MATLAKVGGHFRDAHNAASATWAQNTNSLKALDDPTYIPTARAGALTVFRQAFSTQDITNPAGGTSTADQVIAALGGQSVGYIEGFNEINVDCPGADPNALADYIAWTQAFVYETHQKGQKAACFSFAVGTPCNMSATWAAIAQSGLLSGGSGGCDAIALHEYWGSEGPTGPYTAMRHEMALTAIKQAGISNPPPFIITEMGRDCVCQPSPCPSNPPSGGCGWQGQGLSADQFMAELQTWDQAVANDPSVLGGMVFTHGGCPDFCSFEIDPLAQYLTGSSPSPNPSPTGGAQGQCIADPDCIALHGNGYYCQNPNTAQSSCQQCPTTTAAGWVLRAQTAPNDTAGYIGAGITVLGAIGLAAIASAGK